jgi:hypothetical protein
MATSGDQGSRKVVRLPPDEGPAGAGDLAAAEEKGGAAQASRSDMPLWQILATVAGALAGLGLFLVVLGAAVVYVRLLAAGLPAEQGLAATPKEALAVAGAHVLALPIVIGALAVSVANYHSDLEDRKVERALDKGVEPPETLYQKLTRWGNKRFLVKPRRKLVRLPVYALIGLVYVLSLPFYLVATGLAKLKLRWAYWLLVVPLSWFWVTFVLAIGLAWRWSNHVYADGHGRGMSLRQMRIRSGAALVLASAVAALAGQADKPSKLSPVTAHLTGGAVVHGLEVADTSEGLYLGDAGKLTMIPRSRLTSVAVGKPPKPPKGSEYSVILRLFVAIF